MLRGLASDVGCNKQRHVVRSRKVCLHKGRRQEAIDRPNLGRKELGLIFNPNADDNVVPPALLRQILNHVRWQTSGSVKLREGSFEDLPVSG